MNVDITEKARQECIEKLITDHVISDDAMMRLVRQVCAKYGVSCLDLKKSHLVSSYQGLVELGSLEKNKNFEDLVRKRKIRTASGVSVISVMTKPLDCPGRCIYCPSQKNMPKSYLDSQPAAMRGVMNNFDPFEQVTARLQMLTKMGHDITKNEVIVLGGTFSAHPVCYQEIFIKRLFDAFNSFGGQAQVADNLSVAKKINETAICRMIGLTIETRPDYINERELQWLRYLGVTRVELGVQTTNDEILKHVKRGHDSAEVRRATKLLRQAGFKIVYHMMPGLPLATHEKDVQVFKELFSDPGYFPDHLKIYPTVVLRDSELFERWKAGKYQPYDEKQVIEVLREIKSIVPPWVRIVRVMRDIPENDVVDGAKSSNLRQLIHNAGVNCVCIRCREPKQNIINDYHLTESSYQVEEGKEIFIAAESDDKKYILSLVRLFLPGQKRALAEVLPELNDCAIIRELHTYGVVTGVNKKGEKTQHRGLGKKMMMRAEEKAIEVGFKKMAVIAGIGVREYYAKLGYRLEGEYMIKDLL